MFIWKTLMLLALIAWIGGLIFFGFVLAPTAFNLLLPEMAGRVVSRSLTILHWMGIASGLVFLICSVLCHRAKYARLKVFTLLNVLVVIMLGLTFISQFRIMPRMDRVRAGVHFLRDTDPNILAWPAEWAEMKGRTLPGAEAEFDHLHRWSVRLEGGVLVLGIVVVVLTARRF